MESTLSIVASICGILGFLLSLFAIKQVYNIKKTINSNKVYLKGKTKIGGDFIGRDKN
jgi:hypothetical protein